MQVDLKDKSNNSMHTNLRNSLLKTIQTELKKESEIIQQANEIALKVSEESCNGNVIASLINQTSTTIKLKARNIEFEGLVTANSNFKILSDGSIEAVNAKLLGSITETRMISPQRSRYYGEVGVTGGPVGLGLYNANRASSPYFRVVEELLGNSFNGFKLLDDGGNIRLRAAGDNIFIYGKNNSYYKLGGQWSNKSCCK